MSQDTEETIKAEFDKAVKRSQKLPTQSTNVQLDLYGLYKQALFGNVTADRPGRLKVRERAKYDAWASREGMSKINAMKEYIKLINQLETSLKEKH